MTDLLDVPVVEREPGVRPSGDLGNPPRLEWIAIHKLRVDPSYQRDVGRRGARNVNRIAGNFRWTRCSPLVVSDRGDGTFAIVDGQHRASAARLHGGIKAMPCLVISCVREEEAEAFAAINGAVTALSPLQIYHAELASGDRKARAIRAMCERAAVSVPRYAMTATKRGETLAIGTIKSCWKTYGEDIVELALSLIVGTGDGNTGYVRAPLISGLCQLLKANPGLAKQPRELRRTLHDEQIPKLYAKALRIQGLDGGSVSTHFAALVLKAVDRREFA